MAVASTKQIASDKVTSQITSAAIHVPSDRVYVVDKKGALLAVRLSDFEVLHTNRGGYGGIRSVSVDPSGRFVATGNERKHGRLWRAADLMPLGALTGHKSVVERLVFSRSGEKLAADWKGAFTFGARLRSSPSE